MAMWYEVSNADEIDSPALLVYPERVEANIKKLIELAGGVKRLRPHVKTHKMPEVVKLHLKYGIDRFKCATIAEAEMLAKAGAREVLLAYQPVGPRAHRLLALAQAYPAITFQAIVDDENVIRNLSALWSDAGFSLELLLDLDTGMHRTGIAPGPKAIELYKLIATLPGLTPGGLHPYDGQFREEEPEERKANADQAFSTVLSLKKTLEKEGLNVPRIVAGGSPTFPVHAARPEIELSPGTYVFWDAGYGSQFPDIPFQPAAVLLCRILSKPGGNRLCIDLGHKAVAAENPLERRVQFLNLDVEAYLSHSEEHLVVTSRDAANWKVGDVVYGIPWHVCPTVALHKEAHTVLEGVWQGSWKITARDRMGNGHLVTGH